MILALVTGIAVLPLAGCNDEESSRRATSSSGNPSTPPPAQPPSATTGSATLSWVAPTQTSSGDLLDGLSGFRVYYGQSSVQLNRWTPIADPTQTTTTIPGLGAGTWYFAVSAITVSGVESAKSTIVSKRI
jgi:hypothetical protein